MGDKHKNSKQLKTDISFQGECFFFLICTSWSHFTVENFLRRNQKYLNQFCLYHTKLIVYLLLRIVK